MRVRVCDIDGSKDQVQRYKVTRTEGPQTVTVDMCASCAAPFESVLSRARKSRRVVSLKEVAAAKKSPAKKSARK